MDTNPGPGGYQPVAHPSGLADSGDEEPSTCERRSVRAAFIDSIARDVRRPLAMILSAANSLKRRGAVAQQSVREELIGIVESEAERLDGFVSILADMAKLEADAIQVQAEPLQLDDIVRLSVNDAVGDLQDHKTEVSLSANLPKLRLDPAILQRVLGILIRNAAARTPLHSTVSVQASRDTTGVRLQIMDQGNGIPTSEIDSVFSRFHLPCIDDESGWRSAGMQLAVCRGYVEAMGGMIAAGNRTDGNGAVFTITFPYPPAAERAGLT